MTENERELVVDPVILGELLFGILLLPKGKRRDRLMRWFDGRLHCLTWSAKIGIRWAQLLAHLKKRGRSMPVKDSLIAATALAHGLTLVTRNTTDFEHADIKVLSPFDRP